MENRKKVEMDYDKFTIIVGLLALCGRCANMVVDGDAKSETFSKAALRACGRLGYALLNSGAVNEDECVEHTAEFVNAFGREHD